MSNSTRDQKHRRIAHHTHNRFVAEGVAPHRATSIATESLLEPLSHKLTREVEQHQREIEAILAECIGRPTYTGPGFILYCGDCTDLLPRISVTSLKFDLTVTSPPYNIGKEYENALDISEFVDWCAEWMTQIHDVTSVSGAFWLNIGYFNVPKKGLCVPIPYLLWDKSPFYLLQEVVWKYGAGVSAKRRLSPRNEKWLFYVRNAKQYTFNLDDIRDPNVKYPNQKKNGKYRCNPLGKNPSDVWEFPKVTTGASRSSRERTSHPAQFPLPVVERIVRASSNTCELICDPFAGSCSTGIAASGAGRLFLGFEIRDDYCKVAVERYERFQRHRSAIQQQATLF